MFVEFNQLSPASKVWVYQSDRELNEQEKEVLSQELRKFTDSWDSHGNPLKGSYQIYHNYFIIIAADESYNSASGCSVDKSVDVIKGLENELNVKLLERGIVAYRNNGNISIVPFTKIKNLVEEGIISKETLIYNNSISNLSELNEKWEIPADKSWISKYFNN